jgi:hypothetical protein
MITQNIDSLIHNYKELKKSFKLRESTNYAELITSSGSKIFCSKNDRFKAGLFLFGMVKRDVNNYLEENGDVEPYDTLPVNHSNTEFDYDKKIVGLDINNAYWSVAHLKGYITEKTYKRGISKDGLKEIRLASLSTLGQGRTYQIYKEGVYSHDEQYKSNVRLQNLYLDIRYSTYGVMYDIATQLGEDFCCWKTDCIFFHDTEENQKLVRDCIEEYGLECKVETKSLKKLKPPKQR